MKTIILIKIVLLFSLKAFSAGEPDCKGDGKRCLPPQQEESRELDQDEDQPDFEAEVDPRKFQEKVKPFKYQSYHNLENLDSQVQED